MTTDPTGPSRRRPPAAAPRPGELCAVELVAAAVVGEPDDHLSARPEPARADLGRRRADPGRDRPRGPAVTAGDPRRRPASAPARLGSGLDRGLGGVSL